MRTVAELHTQLAYIIGDPIRPINSNIIPDGVRFSRVLRENYLQRAFDEIIALYVQQILAVPNGQSSMLINRLFPTSLSVVNVPSILNNMTGDRRGESNVVGLTNLNLRVAYWVSALYNATDSNNVNGLINYTKLPVPIHDPIKTNALLNSRSVQYPDAFFRQDTYQIPTGQWMSDLYLYDYASEINSNNSFTFTFLEYVPLLRTLNFDSVVKFEDMYIGMVFQKAAEFAKIDSQEKDYQPQQQG